MPNEESRDKTGRKATVHLVQGIGHLWKAARYAASGVRSGVSRAAEKRPQLSRASVTKTLDDAGKELARAANNVAERITGRGGASTTPSDLGDEPSAKADDTVDTERSAPGDESGGRNHSE